MRFSCTFVLFVGAASAWDIPFLQRLFHFGPPRIKPPPPKPVPIRFDTQPNCTSFLAQLNQTAFIAYNYGLDENTPGCGRDLVNCLSTEDATEARANVSEIYLALPAVGRPKPNQTAFVELVNMLPNLEIIQYGTSS